MTTPLFIRDRDRDQRVRYGLGTTTISTDTTLASTLPVEVICFGLLVALVLSSLGRARSLSSRMRHSVVEFSEQSPVGLAC